MQVLHGSNVMHLDVFCRTTPFAVSSEQSSF
jgi:hypothetical protein